MAGLSFFIDISDPGPGPGPGSQACPAAGNCASTEARAASDPRAPVVRGLVPPYDGLSIRSEAQSESVAATESGSPMAGGLSSRNHDN